MRQVYEQAENNGLIKLKIIPWNSFLPAINEQIVFQQDQDMFSIFEQATANLIFH